MPEEREKPGGPPHDPAGPRAASDPDPDDPEVEGGPDSERPTEIPPFDPAAFARDVLKPSPQPMNAVRPNNPHTLATPPQGTTRRKTPTSTLSLANARIPSNLPPRVPARIPPPPPSRVAAATVEPPVLNPVDREWEDLELATRPPPADGPGEDPVLEITPDRSAPLDLDDIDLPPSQLPPRDIDDEHSVDTVRRPIPAEIIKPRAQEMNDRISLGDYSGALDIAERILADNPDDTEAKACGESCRTVLRQMYATRIGPLDRVPVVMVPRDQLRWLSIDHKAGFVLSLVDGVSSLEMIIDVSGMPELDTLRILSELAQQRIISLR